MRVPGMIVALTGAICTLMATDVVAAPTTKPARPLNVVVVTGGHGFDIRAFPKLFEGYDDIHVTHYAMKGYTEIFDDAHMKDWPYDAVVFYSMTQVFPEDRKANFLKLLNKGVGVVSLHHNIWAYPDWPEFARIIGGRQFAKDMEFEGKSWKQSTYKHGIAIKVRVEEPNHPLTAGLTDWTIEDETYHGLWIDPDAKILRNTSPVCNGFHRQCR